MVEPVGGGPLLDGIAFNVDTTCWPDNGWWWCEVQLSFPHPDVPLTSFAATAACRL
jgi:hypothetical protein